MCFKMVKKCRADAAFTLVEVMVAVGVLGITMVAFFACLGSGLSIMNTARQDLRATQILTQKTEFVRLCNWQQLLSLPSSFQDYYYDSSGTTNDMTNLTYYGTITVSNVPSTCIPTTVSYYNNIRLVTIGLVWTNYLGVNSIAHHREVQTLVSYNGLFNYLTSTNL